MERVKRYVGVFKYTSTTKRFEGRPDVCFYVTLKRNGQKERHKIGWRSQGVDAAYANAKRVEMVNQIKLGEQPRVRPPETLTLAEAWQLYYDNHCKTNTKHPKKLLSVWNSLIKDHLGEHLLCDLSTMDLEGYKAILKDLGKSPKTTEHALAVIRQVYNKMEDWGQYSGNIPTKKVTWPEYDNQRERWLTPAQARDLMDRIKKRCRDKKKLFWRLCMMALLTGMRFGELASLRGESVNLDAGTIRVLDTKGGTDRTVFIDEELRQVLAGLDITPGRLVFPSRGDGMRTEPSDTFRNVVEEMNLNKGIADRRHRVVFHSLRHTFGSWLAISGVPLYWIAKLMGHTNEEVTERYSHLCPGVHRQAVNCIDAAFRAQEITPGLWFSLAAKQNTDPNPDDDTEHSFLS